ncbi:MAG: adenosylcobinamide-phosphate synthase CbiB [Bacillota bacterium]
MTAGILLAALLCDLLVGDPPVSWHPVRLIGRYIACGERRLFKPQRSPAGQRWSGAILVLAVVITCYGLTSLLLLAAYRIHPLAGAFAAALLLASTIAPRSLAGAGLEIYRLLMNGNILRAREKLAWIVGRDTERLEKGEIVRGTVETVAENMVDGVISPLFYALLGGVPLAMAYRAVNTLDSMLGYKNEKYLFFGWAAARLDDAANFVPARLTGALLVMAAVLLKLDVRGALLAMWRDAPGHPSPNSGIPEAGVAGALGIRLGGINYYRGVPSFRAYMGRPAHTLDPWQIKKTVTLMYVTAGLFTLVALIFLQVFRSH